MAPSKHTASALLRAPALALAALMLLAGCDRGARPDQISTPAPDFSVRDDRASLQLSSLRGQVVVLNFWATWCAPCLEELPSLMKLQEQMPGVRIVTVSIDDDAAAYSAFLKKIDLTLTSVRGGSQGPNLKFGTVRVPETFVIDRAGNIRRKFIGAQDWTNPEIVAYLKKL